ncbi:LETM1-like protein-domain-containing protein [Globomyces pollinis-pini]|nr:LETM1-like protein-domain-containing protein [Globomyces pollinis-pini]
MLKLLSSPRYYSLPIKSLNSSNPFTCYPISAFHSSPLSFSSYKDPISLNYKPPSRFPRISNAITEFKQLLYGVVTLAKGISIAISLWQRSRELGPLTNRTEIRHILRVQQDVAKVVPALVYVVLPFSFFTFPFIFRYFPGVLPSTMITHTIMEIRLKSLQSHRASLSKDIHTKFVDHIRSLDLANSPIPDANLRRDKLIAALDSNKPLPTSLWIEFYPFFFHHLNTLVLPNSLLKDFNRYLGHPISFVFMLPRLLQWIDWIIKDDQLLKVQRSNVLSDYECVEAMEERGFKELLPTNTNIKEFKKSIEQHVDFSTQLVQYAKRNRFLLNRDLGKEGNELMTIDYCTLATIFILTKL